MLQGLMMRSPLLISSLIELADRHHGDVESFHAASRATSTATPTGGARRARQIANALDGLGCSPATASPPWPGTATAT